MFTVYMHKSPSDKVYIGITSLKVNERWRDGKGYSKNQHFYRAIQKYGWDNFEHIILFEGLSEEEAKSEEIRLIAFYNADNKLYGYNQTKGGDHRCKASTEQRRKMSESHKGKCLSEASKEKLRQWNTGRKMSEESKRKNSLAHSGGNNPRSIAILQYSLDGDFIAEWSCIADAIQFIGTTDRSIIKACLTNKREQAYGYKWRYKDANKRKS